jgi:hypothetical protein
VSGRRTKKLQDALAAQGERREASKTKRRDRMRRQKPWQLLRVEWVEEVWRVFGKDTEVQAWGPAEAKLSRALLKEVDIDKAMTMTKRFISWWKDRGREGLPSFKFFWVARGSFRAMVEGKAVDLGSLDDKRVREREYDESAEHNDDAFGWGDV